MTEKFEIVADCKIRASYQRSLDNRSPITATMQKILCHGNLSDAANFKLSLAFHASGNAMFDNYANEYKENPLSHYTFEDNIPRELLRIISKKFLQPLFSKRKKKFCIPIILLVKKVDKTYLFLIHSEESFFFNQNFV